MQRLVEYVGPEEAAALCAGQARQLGATEFARVRNLDYVFAPFDLYPLAPHVRPPLEHVAAYAVDMDGTSTTTEPLALHALEYMVRRFTGLIDKAAWAGLDERRDYPFVIGNSNFRHTEFLIERYGDRLDHASFRQAFFETLLWTPANMSDPQRRRDVTRNARNCGLGDLLADVGFQKLAGGGQVDAENVARLVAPFVQCFGDAFRYRHRSELVGAALDVYYMRYHAILQQIERGAGEQLSHELLGDSGRRLVEPMPGYAVFVPLIKGWLGGETDALFELLRTVLIADSKLEHTAGELDRCRPRLVKLATHFQRQPAKLGLVTASIAHEAHAVMTEVIRLLRQEAADWPVPSHLKEFLAEKLADHRSVFDGFVNASDAHEARLKPHRDLYSIALYQMSIPKPDYAHCVGIEDTEPGIVALRTAGIGCAVALPNRDTIRQDYRAATKIVGGGLPELILIENLLLKDTGDV